MESSRSEVINKVIFGVFRVERFPWRAIADTSQSEYWFFNGYLLTAQNYNGVVNNFLKNHYRFGIFYMSR